MGDTARADDLSSRLVDYLAATVPSRPGARSALRRGLRREPLDCPQMHRFIPAGFVERGHHRERAVYTTASIAATWPKLLDRRGDVDGVSVGTALGRNARRQTPGGSQADIDATWAQRRLLQLCRSSSSEIGNRVASAAQKLVADGDLFSLAVLATDLARWEWDSARIVRRWVRDFDIAAHERAADDIAPSAGTVPSVSGTDLEES
jgi:CRISPR system Cascade subunit CasB